MMGGRLSSLLRYEFIIPFIGQMLTDVQADGAAFAEIKSDGSVVYLGRLPKQSSNSIWRGMRHCIGISIVITDV